MATIIAADIGGTSSRFGRFRTESSPDDNALAITLEHSARFETASTKSFKDLLRMAAEAGFPLQACDGAVLATPGAVQRGVFVAMPNVSWDIDLETLDEHTVPGLHKVQLINDFIAQAYAIPTPIGEAAQLVKTGDADPNGVVAVIGAGTGLGHAALARSRDGQRNAVASEAGHAAFAFIGETEESYHAFLRQKTGLPYAYGDMVVSGTGLSMAHEYLTGEALAPPDVIAAAHPETLALFSRFYARAARHYALNIVSMGGLYIAGGVAAKNPELVDCEAFREEFVRSPTYHELLMHMPIRLIRDESSGLWGAAYHAAQRLGLAD